MPILAWALVGLVASYFVQGLLAPKAQQPKPAALTEFEFAQFEEGKPQAVVFGDVWTSGWFVLWFGNYRTTKVKSGGGKK
jgi:hypothetical protein